MTINAEEKYTSYWSQKTDKQVLKELKSMRAYINRHSAAYAWHGKSMTPPNEISDGMMVLILREILQKRGVEE
jgi:hypothetical protein